MMAVITKAMGAFLVLMVFGLSYYSPGTGSSGRAVETKAEVEDIRRQLADAEKRLTNGTLSEQDRQALIAQLKDLQGRLEEAGRQLGQLRVTLDQRDSVIARLTKDNETLSSKVAPLEARLQALEAERQALLTRTQQLQATLTDREATIAQLRTDNEQLNRQIASLSAEAETLRLKADEVTVILTYDACRGAKISLYVQRVLSGRTENAPPPQRKPLGAFFSDDQSAYVTSVNSMSMERWVLRQVQPGEELKLYLSFQNSLGGLLACQTHITISAGGFLGYDPAIREAAPFLYVARVRYEGGKDQRLTPLPVNEAEITEAAERIKSTPCQGLQCGVDSPEAKPFIPETVVARFKDDIAPVANLEQGNASAELTQARRSALLDLGQGMARGEMKLEDVEHWVAFLRRTIEDMRVGGPEVSAGTLESWRKAILAKKLPTSVADLFIRQVQLGWPDEPTARARLEEYGILSPSIAKVPTIPAPTLHKAGGPAPFAPGDIDP